MPAESEPDTPAELIDAKVEELGDWRGEPLSRIRGLTRQAVPEVVEEIKWRKPSNPSGDAVWSHDGIIFTGETYKDKVKLTFAEGASLEIRPASSTPASRARRGARSTSTRETRSTRRPSRPSSARRPS